MRRVMAETADGRSVTYYLGTGAIETGGTPAPRLSPHPSDGRERRYDRASGEWVLYATDRQERPVRDDGQAAGCPLCPGPASADEWHEVARDDFRIAVFPNRFSPLGPRRTTLAGGEGRRASGGSAELVLYTPRHDRSLADLGEAHGADLVRVWADRTRLLLAEPGVRHVLVFENRGAEVGATLSHPHGQIYALPFVPPRLAALGRRERRAKVQGGAECAFCLRLRDEMRVGTRIVDREGDLLAYVPFAARMPYELTLAPLRCVARLDALSDLEMAALGRLVARTVGRYDRLFGAPMPYMMAVVQAGAPRSPAPRHLRLVFQPVRRSAESLKRLATTETLAGLYLVDLLPETMAERLRQAGEA